MANILFVNEYGEGSFHVNLLAYVADLMKKNGHSCYFSLPLLNDGVADLLDKGYGVFQTPVLSPDLTYDKKSLSPVSLSDIIGTRGFLNQRKLEVIKKIWENELKLRKIDLIFVNFAPTVIQVARQRIPVINLGTFWDTPSSLLKEIPRFQNREKRIKDAHIINILVKVFGRERVPDSLTKALHGDSTYIFNEPEFDNFHPRKAKPRAIGITGYKAIIDAAKFPKTKKVFAYIHPYRRFAMKHLEELSKTKFKIDAYVPGLSEQDKRRLSSESLHFVEKQSYAQLSQNYSVALHQAGQGMCQNMTILGLGQILIPSYPEGGINGASVQGLKVGSVIPPGQHETLSNEKLDTVLEEMLAEDHTKRVWDSTRHFRERARPNIDQILMRAASKYI